MTQHVNSQSDYLRAMSTSYSLEEVRNLMLDARTTVIDAKMVKLDKKEKRILIDKNAYVPFDILVLCVGLIDTLLQNEQLISCGLANSPYYKDKQYIEGVYSIDDPYLYQQFAVDSPNIKLLQRKKKPQNITIYGRTPHTVAFVSGLVNRGVAPERIYFVCPGSNRGRVQHFETNQERMDYEAQLISDPDTFEDGNVEKVVIDHLRTLGVHVELGFEFYEFEGNPCRGIKFRKKADNYEELEEDIKKKRAEIQIKLQEMGNRLTEELSEEEEDEDKISPEKEIELLQQQQWKELYTPCAFFITSGTIDIDREIFNIIHENGLVYNGRLIVKSNFQTTEN